MGKNRGSTDGGAGMALACSLLDMYPHGRMVPLMMLAVLMLYPPPASSPRVEPVTAQPVALPQASPGIQPAPLGADPSVRIEHELVRLPKPRPQRINRPQWRSTRLAAAELPDPRAPLIVRARRAFIGDGRYKPEPFPRLDPPSR